MRARTETLAANIEAMERGLAEILRFSGEQERLWKAYENWNVELHWSDEEKIDLGIKKKDTVMSLDEFGGYISELINDIRGYQEAVECLK